MTNRKELTYKERQDVMWALEMWAAFLEADPVQNTGTSTESAARLRRLHVKYRNGERG